MDLKRARYRAQAILMPLDLRTQIGSDRLLRELLET